MECLTRVDCAGKGGGAAGKICGPNGTCERCASDGQCDLRELCDPKDQRCVFKPGWGRDCAKNGDCPTGRLCVQGLCQLEQDVTLCRESRCLADGQRCNQGNQVCEEDVGCATDSDCAKEELCNTGTTSCVLRCTPEKQSELCAAGQKCVESRCTDCASNADCPGGLVCDKGKLKCLADGSARCASNRDCAVGLTCNRATGFCTAKPPPCVSNEDCVADERCDVPSGKCLRKACQPDRFERNDEPRTATPATAGNLPSLTLCESEQDWFAFQLSRGDHLDVFVDADPLLQDYIDTRILDDTGRILMQGNLAVDRTMGRAGTYYLRMQSQDPYVEYGLRMAVSKGIPCDDDRFEPNDDILHPGSLRSAGEYDKLTLCPNDTDYFSVDVPASNGVRLELFSIPTEGDVDLYVSSYDGKIELGRSVTGNAREVVELNASAIRGASVVVKVSSSDTRTHNEYYLKVTHLPK
jgi:hypothetical protein